MSEELTISPKVEKGVSLLQKYAVDLQITKPDDIASASVMVKEVDDMQATIEEQRTQFTKPLNESLRKINAFFKRFSGPLNTVDDVIRGKMITFKNEHKDIANKLGLIHFVTHDVIHIADEKRVPKEYWSVDNAKVKKALLEGKSVPGVVILTEESVSLNKGGVDL